MAFLPQQETGRQDLRVGGSGDEDLSVSCPLASTAWGSWSTQTVRTETFPGRNIVDDFLFPSQTELISAFGQPVLFGGT